MQDNIENKTKQKTQAKQQKEKRILKNEDSLRNIWDNMQCDNICIMGMPGEETEQGIEHFFEEIMTKNFLNLVKEKDTQVQEAQRIPHKLDPKRHTETHYN